MKKWFYPLGLASLLGFVSFFLTFTKDEVVALDHKMSELLSGNQFIIPFHYLGETAFVIIIMLLLFAYLWIHSKNYRGMLFGLFTVGVGNVLNQLLKKWVQRARPDVPHQLESFSFPSGHAMVGLLYVFTVAYFLTEYQSNKKTRILIWIGAILLTMMIGLSRIAESRHFASDVFAGWMAGYTWFVIVALWYEYRKKSVPKIKL
ncbi:phosphatase PAP2 family protein [Psychrobacillus sp. L4]|uniref:phosphatase PAP2 family protein n=1 Tax=Psychrobacillus sp. L4 TaxID=3236892 RepID=UPI0036F25505